MRPHKVNFHGAGGYLILLITVTQQATTDTVLQNVHLQAATKITRKPQIAPINATGACALGLVRSHKLCGEKYLVQVGTM